jgi:hypothetical protein
VWLVLTVGAAFIGPASNPIGLPDIYWTLLRGSWMAQHTTLIESDPFTSAPHIDGRIVNFQWLADLSFYGLEALGGLPMVITGTATIVALAYAVLLAATIVASGHWRVSCVAVWIAYALGASNLSPRPQTLAYPLFAVFLLAVMRVEWCRDTRLLWLLPPITVLWANVHGSFFTGFVLLGCAALGRFLATYKWTGFQFPSRSEAAYIVGHGLKHTQPYLLTLGACVLASMITPYGPGSLLNLATIGGNLVIREHVTEWAPTTVGLREGPLFFASLILLGALILKSRIRLTPVEVVMLLVFAYLAWTSVRAVVWWGLVMTPTLARVLGSVLPNRMAGGRDLPLVNALIVAGVVGLAVVALPWNKASVPILPPDKRGIFTGDTPVNVGDYLRTHDPPPTGRMLNAQEWGGYLEWAAWPRHQIFLDGRIELHPNQVWFDYLDIVFPSARWRALLAEYDISYLVLGKTDEADLIADLRVDPDWRLDYEDDLAVVFSRVALGVP